MEQTRDSNKVLLVKISNPVELEYITDMLKEMDISFLAEEEGCEHYVSLMEGSDTGVSIYVDKARINEAQELLTPLNAEHQDCEEIKPQEDELVSEHLLEVAQKATRFFKNGFLYPVIILAVILLIMLLNSNDLGETISQLLRQTFVR